jgi:cobalt/nickel transport system ATP-binding protein
VPSAADATHARAGDHLRPPPGPQLEVVDISYAYLGRFPALEGVSLAIQPGERVALLGPNGGGKSTLLKILAGLVFADSGSYRAFGHDVTEDTLEDQQFNEAFRSRLGFVFQNTDAQLFSPTVRDELAFGPLNMGLSQAETSARVDDTLELLDIAALADRAPYQLSEGQKKRVAIGSVLVMNPETLLFDEPTAALDPASQSWFLDLLDELNRAGKTLVVATHDLATVERLADREIVLGEDHRIATDATSTPTSTNSHVHEH